MPSIAPQLLFEVERGPDWLLVTVGSLDCDGLDSAPLADAVAGILEKHSIHRLVLQLGCIPVLTSHLVSELIRLQDWVGEHGGLMRLSGVSLLNQRVLQECRLDGRFQPYSTWEEAVRGCSCPRNPR